MSRLKHSGSCHCGAVTFVVEADLQAGTSRCNCSFCRRARFWKAIVPARDFTLRSGEGSLSEYRFGSGSIRHFFCTRCGIKTHGTGTLPDFGDFVAVNVACLELPESELAALPVEYEDGAHDRWDRRPENFSYL
jgi:hypothetical protein